MRHRPLAARTHRCPGAEGGQLGAVFERARVRTRRPALLRLSCQPVADALGEGRRIFTVNRWALQGCFARVPVQLGAAVSRARADKVTPPSPLSVTFTGCPSRLFFFFLTFI